MSTQTLGWTLIHSLWQGLAIYITLRVLVKFTNRADVRYGAGVSAMALMVISSVITFFVLNTGTSSKGFEMMLNVTGSTSIAQPSTTVFKWIDQNIIWLIRFWALGFVAGLLRIAAGLWYIGRLRRNSYPVADEWTDMVKRLSDALNINRVVSMAEASISSPMVVGFMKPVILFPIGLLSGLTSEQVETILIHELSHIRRQDYIINLVQSVIETIFFFNPFVLLMSSLIREERENCCDDMVIERGISPISYVKTLAQLEAARSSTSLALGFAGNQNQLLNRIKRIMENSAKNDWSKGRLVPVALLFLGLVCASWLSIGSEKKIQDTGTSHHIIVQDTAKDGYIVYKRGSGHNTWMVEPPDAIDHIIGPDSIPPFDMDMNFESFDIHDMPPFTSGMDEFSFPGFDRFDGFDSLPQFDFHIRDTAEWGMFEKEFTIRFKEEFKDFYKNNREEFDKFIQDMKRQEGLRRREAREVVDLEELSRMAEVEALRAADMVRSLERHGDMAELAELQALQQSEGVMLQRMQMDVMEDQLREQSIIVDDMARRTEAYNAELMRLLTEDGYIKKGEDTENISINYSNGNLTVNGHKIKEKDAAKYRALHDSFFKIKQRTMIPGRSE